MADPRFSQGMSSSAQIKNIRMDKLPNMDKLYFNGIYKVKRVGLNLKSR